MDCFIFKMLKIKKDIGKEEHINVSLEKTKQLSA